MIRNPFDSGHLGGTLINDTTSTANGVYYAIQILSDAKFTTLTGNMDGPNGNSAALSNQIFPQHAVIYGAFSAIKLTSGSIIAYKL